MIIDDLANSDKYREHPSFGIAFDFLKNSDLASLSNGRTDLAGDDVFALVSRNGTTFNGAKLEVHRAYLDIHYIVSGSDTIGWKYLPDCQAPIEHFREKEDYQLFGDTDYMRFELGQNKFMVVYPSDAHAPCIETSELFKIVIKIRL
jgi:biofilm protein TabA